MRKLDRVRLQGIEFLLLSSMALPILPQAILTETKRLEELIPENERKGIAEKEIAFALDGLRPIPEDLAQGKVYVAYERLASSQDILESAALTSALPLRFSRPVSDSGSYRGIRAPRFQFRTPTARPTARGSSTRRSITRSHCPSGSERSTGSPPPRKRIAARRPFSWRRSSLSTFNFWRIDDTDASGPGARRSIRRRAAPMPLESVRLPVSELPRSRR